MKQLFSNNARTTVAATFGATDTTLEVLDGSLFPVPNEAGQFFLLTLLRIDGNNQEVGHEVIKCNARVGNTITVEQRAYEGEAASEFAVGAVVSARLTAKSMENLIAVAIAAVELIYDNFDDRYLGAKAADPATDNDGDPLVAGMLYFNTTALVMRVYGGGAWQDAVSAVEGLGQTFQFTATAGQAEFTGNDDSGAALTFDSVGNLMVFLNGVRLVRNIDYSVNDVDKIITLIKPASDLDVLTVDSFSYFASVPLADMALAISGQDNQSLMTPLRTAQAVEKRVADGGIYAKENILGTVSQSAGVPTGAIIERGSNANGEYVKFADGTMICRGEGVSPPIKNDIPAGSLFETEPVAVPFAAEFSDSPSVVVTCRHQDRWGVLTGTQEVSFATMKVFSPISRSSTYRIGYIAVGRWY